MKVQYSRYSTKRTSLNGFINSTYQAFKTRQKDKGIRLTFSKKRFIEWFNKNNGKEMLDRWVNSKQLSSIRPSVDRIDPFKGYSINNIRLITWEENFEKGKYEIYLKRKKTSNPVLHVKEENRKFASRNTPVIQMDLKGNYIAEFNSIADASRAFKVSGTGILFACKGKHKTACGYKWKYKNK